MRPRTQITAVPGGQAEPRGVSGRSSRQTRTGQHQALRALHEPAGAGDAHRLAAGLRVADEERAAEAAAARKPP